MKKENPSHSKRVRNLIGISALSAIVLLVATFAWFIGMQTVNVNSFDVEIAAIDGLELSFDGVNFDTTVTINKDNYNKTTVEHPNEGVTYEGHTNNWAGRGLIPMSTAGKIDNSVSRLIMYEKASLTAVPESTPGGYRLMVSRVDNYGAESPERDGYVVFDLFIRNKSGNQYLTDLDAKGEEAIYLTPDSSVTVAADVVIPPEGEDDGEGGDGGDEGEGTTIPGGIADSGIENSVRVAFAQIGRVTALKPLDAAVVTGITCTSDDNVTGICRDATIWEPNDRDHVGHAISYYDTNCSMRKTPTEQNDQAGADVTSVDSYAGKCNPIYDGLAYPTYSAKTEIGSGNNVNIYDGLAYNSYEGSGDYLTSYSYFTDTMKFLRGRARPAFMTLEPASITKVRVYIYLEGQDIDNYDFAAIGKKISVKFGFSKFQLYPGDSEYNGPDINQGLGPNANDITVPEIRFLDAAEDGDPIVDDTIDLEVNPNFVYNPEAPIVFDGVHVELSDNIDSSTTLQTNLTIKGVVNQAVPGTYYVLYKVYDTAGNMGHRMLIVNVVEPNEP